MSGTTKTSDGRRASDLSEWYAAQYAGAVGLADAEGGARFRELAKDFPVRNGRGGATYPMTGRQRMSNFLNLKLRYPLGPAGYDCLALTAQLGPHKAHYGYAYWRRGAGPERGEPEYICVSPTFDSRDGEYRRRFTRYPTFAAAYAEELDWLAAYEAAALAMAGDGRLVLGAVAYPEESAEADIRWAEAARLPVVAFAVALALDLAETERGMLMAHTSGPYAGLMREIAGAWPSLVGFRGVDPAKFYRGDNAFTVQCGQKLVPMFVREVTQVADYNLAAWRELAVARLAGDLVLNYVAPGFPLYNQWTYVEGADAALFENPAMEARYVRGRAVAEATRSLREARRLLGAEAKARENYYTEELGSQLFESLEYAQSFLLTSQVALLHTMEDVGWALRSLGDFVRRASTQWPAAVEVFATAGNAARLLFEYAYGAHCLHTKLGVAHTDLHGNNLTYYMWGLSQPQPTAEGAPREPYYEDPLVAYVAGPRGEADTYIFPAAGSSGCLIDFSRCILGPSFRPRLEAGRAPQYAQNFYRDQVNRVMRTFHRYAPAYVEKHQEALKAAVLANFEAAFPVLCAVDFIAIGRSVGAYLAEAGPQAEEGEARPFIVAPAALELAARLESAARDAFITGLHDLAESAGARQQMRVPAFPGPALFEAVFGEWLFPRWAARDPRRLKTAALVDCYNFGNPLRYAGADYAEWPPWARLDEIERHLGELRLSDLFERGVEPFLEALQPGAHIEVIAERLRAEQERLDGPPVAVASSWLGD